MPRPPARSRRISTTGILAALLVAAAFLTTLWTAAGLQPASAMLGYRPAASAWNAASSATIGYEETDHRYDVVSESFLFAQIARAFLAAPWLLPDAGQSRTWRPTPAAGWTFPLHEADEGEQVGAGGMMLSESSTAVLVDRMRRDARVQQLSSTGTSDDAELNEDVPQTSTQQWTSQDGTPWGRDEAGEDQAYDDVAPAPGAADDLKGEIAATDEEGERESPPDETDQAAAEEAAGASRAESLAAPNASGVVRAVGQQVAIRYLGGRDLFESSERDGGGGSDSDGKVFLALCSASSQWLCASASHTRRRSARFELLPLLAPLRRAPRPDQSQTADASGTEVEVAGGGVNRSRAVSSATGVNRSSAVGSSSAVASSATDASATDPFGGWFALRSLRTGSLVGVAPASHANAWVVRASESPLSRVLRARLLPSVRASLRAPPPPRAASTAAASQPLAVNVSKPSKGGRTSNFSDEYGLEVGARLGNSSDEYGVEVGARLGNSSDEYGLEVGALELWRRDGDALRNLGTGALLNYRGGGPEGDGISVRAHGDVKPRRAAWRHTRQTHFEVVRLRPFASQSRQQEVTEHKSM